MTPDERRSGELTFPLTPDAMRVSSSRLRLSTASEIFALGASWQRIAAVIVANMLGTGVLSIPHSASVLGWLPFALVLSILTVGALLSGKLFAQLYDAAGSGGRWSVLSDAAHESHGYFGELVVSSVVYVYMLSLIHI